MQSVSPRSGSLHGGTILTITGTSFGRLKENVKVKVAGVQCHVLHVSRTVVKCRTGTAEQRFLEGDVFPGLQFVLQSYRLVSQVLKPNHKNSFKKTRSSSEFEEH